MELCYENLKNDPRAFRAFTGFDVKEFQILLQAFTIAWERYVQQHRLPLEIRQRGYGVGRKARLANCEDKLLFILVYFKTYPLQDLGSRGYPLRVIAFHFDMSQGQAYQWIQVLSEVLLQTLTELGQFPERDPQKVKERLETYIKYVNESHSGNEADTEPNSPTSPKMKSMENFAIDGTE